MQTFLPYTDLFHIAHILDSKRLGKQRVEAKQLLDMLTGAKPIGRWASHPIVLMWKGYEQLLADYGMAMCSEWCDRGYSDSCYAHFDSFKLSTNAPTIQPWWWGHTKLMESHQSNLLRKNRTYYQNFFPKIHSNLPYWWPTQHTPIAQQQITWSRTPIPATTTSAPSVHSFRQKTAVTYIDVPKKPFVPKIVDGKLSWDAAPFTGWSVAVAGQIFTSPVPSQPMKDMAKAISNQIDDTITKELTKKDPYSNTP